VTDIHQVLQGITGWGSQGLCEYEQCRTDPKTQDLSIKGRYAAGLFLHLSQWKWT